ncbi:class I SAM-dependent methyltransferase [Mycetocola tolaasinivorans]|uniref:Class I SAM-dependent methyltransferase n=1 Tax=Mycetocola tolaasinivorans TaxID=76635 RepID=A0A3L7ACH7_9MICO|nr:class I SAM-dependent methyltransferase [Mycetocola tolaasinivorans]RLP77927.1 class I SAM-dependent methyltransferase [Mycetocola tolaasinivorans]
MNTPPQPTEHTFDRRYWESHWNDSILRGSHQAPPHPHLDAQISGLLPGRALDAGCGTGAETIRLAEAGWSVTGADISAGALSVARGRAKSAGVRDRVSWLEADLGVWEPARPFDLVLTAFAHPAMPQLDFYARIARWVTPGGTLLIFGHAAHASDASDASDASHAEHPHEASASAAGITALLPAGQWHIDTAEEVVVPGTHPGGAGSRVDVIVRATRIG